MSSIKFGDRVPDGFFLPELSSADSEIGTRTFVEIPAEGNIEFGSSNKVMEFHINNSQSFLDTVNSYIRCSLSSTVNIGASTAHALSYLAEGGIHSLIDTVEILTANYVLLERIDDYNRYYSGISSAMHPRHYIESVGFREADSADFLPEGSDGFPLTGTVAITAATGAVTGSSTLFTAELSVGDSVFTCSSSGVVQFGTVGVITSNTAITITPLMTLAGVAGSDVGAGATLFKCTNIDFPARWLAAHTVDSSMEFKVCFQPLSGFLELPEVKAIPFMSNAGIIIRITWADAWKGFAASFDTAAVCSGSYKIKNPIYVANLVTPKEAVMQQWYDKYRNDEITYAFISPMTFQLQDTGAATANIKTINSALRSVKAVIQKIGDSRSGAESTGSVNPAVSSWGTDSVAQARKAGLSFWQLNAGGQFYFPTAQPMDLSKAKSRSNAEALAHLENCFGALGNSLSQHRFKPCEYMAYMSDYHCIERGRYGGNAEPQRMVLGLLLAKDPSPMCGIDLLANNLINNCQFEDACLLHATLSTTTAATASIRYYYIFLLHDRFVNLSAKNGTTVTY